MNIKYQNFADAFNARYQASSSAYNDRLSRKFNPPKAPEDKRFYADNIIDAEFEEVKE